ncbi:hypothetical protein [Halofilum ochraceum]|uniref:hypothetical protein n=1 Tax=Halofilum ochraceum TaxID=1611323 RepID=UPI0008D8F1FC|nr:hypothetical protein [Halofilum ochraceum]
MTRKHRHFTADYKHRIARMVVDDGLKVADVCRDQNLGETAHAAGSISSRPNAAAGRAKASR